VSSPAVRRRFRPGATHTHTSGFLGLSSTTTNSNDVLTTDTAVGTTVSGNKVFITSANGGIGITDGQVSGTHGVALNALGPISVVNGTDTTNDVSTSSESHSGLSLNIGLGGIGISAGTSNETSNQTETTTTAAGSHIVSTSGDVTVSSKSAVVVTGSGVAGNNVTISGSKVTFNAAPETSVGSNSSESSGASVGIGIGWVTGPSISAGVTSGQGSGSSSALAYADTTIAAQNVLTVNTPGDAVVNGAQLIGRQVVGNIGGTLDVTTLQDTTSQSQQASSSSAGLGLSLPGFLPSVSFSGTTASGTGASATVVTPSGVYAGDGGYQFNVGSLNCTACYFTSSAAAAAADRNSLSTGAITSSVVNNSSTYSASASGGGVSLSAGLAGLGSGTALGVGSALLGLAPTVGAASAGGNAASVTTGGITANATGPTVILTGQGKGQASDQAAIAALTSTGVTTANVASQDGALSPNPNIQALTGAQQGAVSSQMQAESDAETAASTIIQTYNLIKNAQAANQAMTALAAGSETESGAPGAGTGSGASAGSGTAAGAPQSYQTPGPATEPSEVQQAEVQAASDAKAAVASQAAADQINDTSTGLDTLAAMYPGYQPYADQAAQVDAQANAATQAANAAAATALQSANAAAALSLANANAVSATAGAADEQASNANTAWNTLAADPNATPQAQQQAALGADQADTAAANDHGAAYADANQAAQVAQGAVSVAQIMVSQAQQTVSDDQANPDTTPDQITADQQALANAQSQLAAAQGQANQAAALSAAQSDIALKAYTKYSQIMPPDTALPPGYQDQNFNGVAINGMGGNTSQVVAQLANWDPALIEAMAAAGVSIDVTPSGVGLDPTLQAYMGPGNGVLGDARGYTADPNSIYAFRPGVEFDDGTNITAVLPSDPVTGSTSADVSLHETAGHGLDPVLGSLLGITAPGVSLSSTPTFQSALSQVETNLSALTPDQLTAVGASFANALQPGLTPDEANSLGAYLMSQWTAPGGYFNQGGSSGGAQEAFAESLAIFDTPAFDGVFTDAPGNPFGPLYNYQNNLSNLINAKYGSSTGQPGTGSH
jgi:hypothetical protein